MLAKIEARRTNKIADIFDEQHVDLVQRQVAQGAVNHPGIEMACISSGYLNDGNPMSANAPGIIIGFKVAFDDGDTALRRDGVDRRLEQRRLAGTGRRHQVDRENAASVEVVAIVLRRALIGIEQASPDRLDPRSPVGSATALLRLDIAAA